MIRRSHPWFTPQTLQIRIVVSSSYIVNTHRMSSKHGSNPLSLRRTELCEPCILLRFRKTQRTRRRSAEVGTGNGPERRTGAAACGDDSTQTQPTVRVHRTPILVE